MTNIVCKKWFLFSVEIKTKCCWTCCLGTSNRPRQQIKLHRTSWKYPLTYIYTVFTGVIYHFRYAEVENSPKFILYNFTLITRLKVTRSLIRAVFRGNLLTGLNKKTVIQREFQFVFICNTQFIRKQNGLNLHFFSTIFYNKNVLNGHHIW